MTAKSPLHPDRIAEAVDAAMEKFWVEIARRYPTAQSGDLDPEALLHMEDTARAAVARWVSLNVPTTEEPCALCSGVQDHHVGLTCSACGTEY